jgi:hypothetical protein
MDAMQGFGDRQARIDLLVGTHYDADHLDGLMPIADTVAITQAWLPPVANDVEPHGVDEALRDGHLLANQFYSEGGQRILARYLDAKAQICQLLRPASGEFVEQRRVTSADTDELPRLRRMFEQWRDEAVGELQFGGESEPYSHADENDFDPPTLRDLLKYVDSPIWKRRDLNELAAGPLRGVRPRSVASRNLAGLRKSAASDAINAISLARLTKRLRARGIPMCCRMIPDGALQRFVWRAASGPFEAARHVPGEGPSLLLLGPSESLVRKHWNRLPVGVYAEVAFHSAIELRKITPSNQLSYVLRFSAEEQRISVSGDAGLVDFKDQGRRPYYEEMLESLLPLHVVQVAHHAGYNAHFCRVLQAVEYPGTAARSFLLVSHATRDRHRPSREFRDFVADVRRDPENVSVLFTTQPMEESVRDFESLVHPRVGPPAEEGDVRLEFGNGEWRVTKHAIVVGRPQTAGAGGVPSVALERAIRVGSPWTRFPPNRTSFMLTGRSRPTLRIAALSRRLSQEPGSASLIQSQTGSATHGPSVIVRIGELLLIDPLPTCRLQAGSAFAASAVPAHPLSRGSFIEIGRLTWRLLASGSAFACQ